MTLIFFLSVKYLRTYCLIQKTMGDHSSCISGIIYRSIVAYKTMYKSRLRIGLDQVHFLKASKSSAPWGTDSIVPFPFRGLFFIVPHCSCRRWLSPRSRSAKRIVFLSSLSPPGFSHFFPSATFPRTTRMILISCFAFRRIRYFPP